jgi:hypothetical protein
MYLASDYTHPTPRGSRCRVRIYLPKVGLDYELRVMLVYYARLRSTRATST